MSKLLPVPLRDLTAWMAGRWRWRKARTLTELANLQADQLARTRAQRCAEETLGWKMYSTLIALGRAGFVVNDWRPGTFGRNDEIGVTVETRACVTGFADDETKDWLDDLMYYAGLEHGATKYELTHVFELYGPGCLEYDRYNGDDAYRNGGRATVERIDGTVTHRIGSQMNEHQVRMAFPVRRSAHQELRKAWQVTIVAPEWGHSHMWDDLLRMITEDRQATVS